MHLPEVLKHQCGCARGERDGAARRTRAGSEPSHVAGILGQIKSVGSDTLGHEITFWAKAFKELYPDVNIEIEASGSATAPAALLEGASQFGPMSRPMSAEEAGAFEKKYGYKVASFRIAVDALAIYVNKDNPIQCLTVQQLNRIFSTTRRTAGGGASKPGVMLA